MSADGSFPDASQALQAAEYGFPYHYLASLDGSGFRAYRAWDWSLSYVTALRRVTDALAELGAASVLDVGCGDGALIHHLHHQLPGVRLAGVDYDPRAIAFARLFTPDADFRAGDIGQERWDQPFAAATLVEVLEHIPPAEVAAFLRKVRATLAPGGRLIVTVPHVNKPVEAKHYRHFSFAALRAELEPLFEVEEIYGFERLDPWKARLRKLTDNRHWFFAPHTLNRAQLRRELAFRSDDERGCGRIFAIGKARQEAP